MAALTGLTQSHTNLWRHCGKEHSVLSIQVCDTLGLHFRVMDASLVRHIHAGPGRVALVNFDCKAQGKVTRMIGMQGGHGCACKPTAANASAPWSVVLQLAVLFMPSILALCLLPWTGIKPW